jgi:hypothetical protein
MDDALIRHGGRHTHKENGVTWYDAAAGGPIAVRVSSHDTNGAYAVVESIADPCYGSERYRPSPSRPSHRHWRQLKFRNIFVEGLFARFMYRALRLMHDRAIGGTSYAVLRLLARALARRTGPPVKLH